MSSKDLANNIRSFQMYKPQVNVQNATVVLTSAHSIASTNGAMVEVCLGSSAGTLAANLAFSFQLLECATTGGSYTAVANADVTYGTTDANGTFALVNADGEDDQNYQIGYAGGLGFLKVQITGIGNHSSAGCPMAVNAITQKIHLPETGSDDGTPTGTDGA